MEIGSKHSEEAKRKISEAGKGREFTVEHKERLGLSKIEDRNPMWKGNSVGYGSLHLWVKSRLPKTSFCQRCKKSKPYDLANKGIYDRELTNWEWLCRKCHMIKDGRLANLIDARRKRL